MLLFTPNRLFILTKKTLSEEKRDDRKNIENQGSVWNDETYNLVDDKYTSVEVTNTQKEPRYAISVTRANFYVVSDPQHIINIPTTKCWLSEWEKDSKDIYDLQGRMCNGIVSISDYDKAIFRGYK